jgi:hypothetical protein
VATLKEFEVAAYTQKDDDDEGVAIPVPDLMTQRQLDAGKEQTYTNVLAYKPDEAQFAVLMATTGRGTSDADRIAGFINFFVNIMDENGADYLTGRLLNRRDPFGIDDVEKIMEDLSGEWTGNPTHGSSASTPSPSSDGPKSTGSSLLT